MWYKTLEKKTDMEVKKYLDYDPINKIFYNNFYLNKFNFVLKVALISPLKYNADVSKDIYLKEIKGEEGRNHKFEKFDLTKYVYLLHYE